MKTKQELFLQLDWWIARFNQYTVETVIDSKTGEIIESKKISKWEPFNQEEYDALYLFLVDMMVSGFFDKEIEEAKKQMRGE